MKNYSVMFPMIVFSQYFDNIPFKKKRRRIIFHFDALVSLSDKECPLLKGRGVDFTFFILNSV